MIAEGQFIAGWLLERVRTQIEPRLAAAKSRQVSCSSVQKAPTFIFLSTYK
jgi:hypothetical protein